MGDDPFAPQPGPWVPEPVGPQFPEPAVPGQPPPPLPAPPVPLYEIPQPWLPEGYVDPAAETGVGVLEPWRPRLRAAAPAPWSVATVLTATAPMRHTAGPDLALLDEGPFRVEALRLPERSLNPVEHPVPLLSRLRMLHDRLLQGPKHPVGADWYELAGRPAVLDRFAVAPGHPVAGFSLALELTPDDGVLALGGTEPTRAEVLTTVGIPLAATAAPHEQGLTWATPPGWSREEELQLTTDELMARVELRPVREGMDLDAWTDQLFAEAPFLRDLRPLGDREVTVPGLEAARLQRFDWQPSGRGRLVTTVVAGITGDWGFSFVMEVDLAADADVLLADPDEILSWVSVT